IVVGAGSAEIVGGVTSSTLIVCVAVVILPQSSVAVHVRVMLELPAQTPGVVTSAKLSSTSVSQRSVAVGVVHDGVASQLIVYGPGRPRISGGVRSPTRIGHVAAVILPHSAAAVHVLRIQSQPAHTRAALTS